VGRVPRVGVPRLIARVAEEGDDVFDVVELQLCNT
jgi:hypothetical protein